MSSLLEAELLTKKLAGTEQTECYKTPQPVRFRWKDGEEVRSVQTDKVCITFDLDGSNRVTTIAPSDYKDVPTEIAEVSVVIDNTADHWGAAVIPDSVMTVDARSLKALRQMGFQKKGCGCGKR